MISLVLIGLMSAMPSRTNLYAGAGGIIEGTVKTTGLATNADAVVYIQQMPGAFALPAKPVNMDQQGKQFIPRVLPVLVGTTIRFLNSDRTHHNVFSPDYEKYNLGTWREGQTRDHTFSTCPKAPCVYVQLCRLHPEMEAHIVVLQNSFFATTVDDGHYAIDNVPPGTYSLAVWHAKGKSQPKPVTVVASKSAVVDFVLGR
jgi:plastocyanin